MVNNSLDKKRGGVTKIDSKKQIIIGSILSYALLFFDLAVALFLPKWINSVVGQSNYGVYTLTNSLVAMFLIDFGLGAAASKFLSKCVVENDEIGEKNILGIIYKIYIFIDLIIFVVFVVLYFVIDKVYTGLTADQISVLKIIFPIIAVYNTINFPFLSLEGSFVSHEQFIAFKGFSLFQKVLYTGIVSVFLILKMSIVFISIASVASGLIAMIGKIVFCRIFCNFKPNFKYKNKDLTKKIFGFSLWITISAIASKLISSFMPSILGVVSNANNIAVYGYAYALQCNAFALTVVISGMLLPNLTRLINNKEISNKEVDDLAIKVGRIQTFIISLFFGGFIICGREFLYLLMGPSYLNSYLCFIFLFIPNLLSGSLAVCEKVSHVTNNIKYIAISQIVAASLVIAFAFLFGKKYGAFGVSLGYAIFETLSQVFIIVYVYLFKQKMNIKRIVLSVFPPIVVPLTIAIVGTLILKRYLPSNSWLSFFVIVVCFSVLFILFYYLFATNSKEKILIYKKLFKKKQNKCLFDSSDECVFIADRAISFDSSGVAFLDCNINHGTKIIIQTKRYGFLHYKLFDDNPFVLTVSSLKDFSTKNDKILICDEAIFQELKVNNDYYKIIVIPNGLLK